MAIVYDFFEEKRKRRGPDLYCMLCNKPITQSVAAAIPDDAEIYIVCKKCEDSFRSREMYECQQCGREVFTLYPNSTGTLSVCAICLNSMDDNDDYY